MGIVGLYGVYPLLSQIAEAAKQKHSSAYQLVSIVLLLIFLADVIARLFLGSNYVGP